MKLREQRMVFESAIIKTTSDLEKIWSLPSDHCGAYALSDCASSSFNISRLSLRITSSLSLMLGILVV